MKYQFCIRFSEVDVNSASSKAVLDCNKIFLKHGYRDFTFTVGNNSKRSRYYFLLLKNIILFFFKIQRGSIIGVQYPLLSINKVFKYFIQLAKLKKVSFFCVVHDIHSLRTGGTDQTLIRQDLINLNKFDQIIVHNAEMFSWLKQHGFRKDAILLEAFDYLSEDFEINNKKITGKPVIAYAGNLIKSKFIYELHHISGCRFNLYGPGYDSALAAQSNNVSWEGQYSPEQIQKELQGNFGLIWDGESAALCDNILGNYLKYNAPHKFSLYIAAGLPVIAPVHSAIGNFIKQHKIGILINSIYELESIKTSPQEYDSMKFNVLSLRKRIIKGWFFTEALLKAETAQAK